jgi:hypothetical protein
MLSAHNDAALAPLSERVGCNGRFRPKSEAEVTTQRIDSSVRARAAETRQRMRQYLREPDRPDLHAR